MADDTIVMLLSDHGDMLGSFNYQVQGTELKLGFSDQKAVWHHFGTGTYGPKGAAYTITPKKAKIQLIAHEQAITSRPASTTFHTPPAGW